MDADISRQDRSYRRGLVLGFTIAEIFVLLIFALLLALSLLLKHKLDELKEMKEAAKKADVALAEKSREMSILDEKNRTLERQIENPKEFEEVFRELVLLRETNVALKAELGGLKDRLELVEKDRKQVERILAMAESLSREASNGSISTPEALQSLEEQFKTLVQINQFLKGRNLSEERKRETILRAVQNEMNAPPSLGELRVQLGEKEKSIRELQGRVKYYEARKGARDGTEHPPCWTNPTTGRIESIFLVALTSSGIVVRDNPIPHRIDDKKSLPIQQVVLEEELLPQRFLALSRPLFEWSRNKDCRFFVDVYDKGKDWEKEIYKRMLRTVQTHFYTDEIRTGTFELKAQ